jgi:LEA14-like dessication related protein
MHVICVKLGMSYKKLLPFIAIVFCSCTKVKDPEFRRVENFHLKNFGLQEAVIGFNVTYFNPNNFGVTVKEAEADIYLDSVYLGKFVQDSSISVKKNAEFSLPLSGSVALQTALKLNLQDLDKREVLLKADGNVKVGKAGIYVSKPFHYQGKHRIQDFSFGK